MPPLLDSLERGYPSPAVEAGAWSTYRLDKTERDGSQNVWDNPTMSSSKVDSKKRIVLPNGCPGDVFDIQQQSEGRLLLVRLEKPEPPHRKSRQACLEAMRTAPLRPTKTWKELRELTREP